MRRTILHPRSLQPLRPVGYRKDGRAIWPILGGSEPPNQPTPPAPAPPPAQQPPALPAPGTFRDPDTGEEYAFPGETPLAEMNGDQKAEYWRHKSRKHEGTAKARADYDAVKAKADQFDELQRQQQTPSEQAVNAAKDEGKREGAREAYASAAAAVLKTSLTSRGKTPEQAQAVVEATNLATFIGDNGIDTAKVETFVGSIAAPVKGGTPRPDRSQGPRVDSAPTSVSAGRDLFAERHKPRQSAGTTA